MLYNYIRKFFICSSSAEGEESNIELKMTHVTYYNNITDFTIV